MVVVFNHKKAFLIFSKDKKRIKSYYNFNLQGFIQRNSDNMKLLYLLQVLTGTKNQYYVKEK